jgi:hypothetical protein
VYSPLNIFKKYIGDNLIWIHWLLWLLKNVVLKLSDLFLTNTITFSLISHLLCLFSHSSVRLAYYEVLGTKKQMFIINTIHHKEGKDKELSLCCC